MAHQTQLKQFGMRIGLAFQIADDVLDLTEIAEKTGKDARERFGQSSSDIAAHPSPETGFRVPSKNGCVT